MTPGALSYLNIALTILPVLIQAGQDIGTWISDLRGVANSKTDPTDAQWSALDKRMQDALAALVEASKPK